MAVKKKSEKGKSESDIPTEAPKSQEVQAEPVKNEEPIIKLFTIQKIKGAWSVVTVTMQGDTFVKKEVSEGSLRAITMESFKIAFGKYLRELEKNL